jgi:hypothetical protein
MAYSKNDLLSIPTLADALQSYTVDYLKKLAALASDDNINPPARPI